jgi:hypothetical protein
MNEQRFSGWIATNRDGRGRKPNKKTMEALVEKMVERCVAGKGNAELLAAALNMAAKAK